MIRGNIGKHQHLGAKCVGDFHQVIRTRMYLTDVADQEEVGRTHGEMFGTIRPASRSQVTTGR